MPKIINEKYKMDWVYKIHSDGFEIIILLELLMILMIIEKWSDFYGFAMTVLVFQS